MGGGTFTGARVAVAVAAAIALGGCKRQPAPHRSDALQRARALLASAAQLESELTAESAELAMHSELTARHEQATEVTCNVVKSHVVEIERLADMQQQKRRLRRARKLALLGNARPNDAWQ
jgi:hypothetical protein